MERLRYPAVPLITVDPYFSIWSCRDHLYDDVTRSWTGSRQNMLGVLTVDGKPCRFMGKLNLDNLYDREIPVIPQTDVRVMPMRTVYTFENEQVRLTVTFMTPLLLEDLKLMSRPVSYISYTAESVDGKQHEAEIYIGMCAEIAVESAVQQVTARVYENGACCGRGDQDVLAVSGDDRRIDWGWLHLFAGPGYTPSVLSMQQAAERFQAGGQGRCDAPVREVPADSAFAVRDAFPYLGIERRFAVNDSPVSGFVCAGYDDLHSILYFENPIDAYYKKDGDTFADACEKAAAEYGAVCARVEAAERDLLERAGKISSRYADIVSLAYRQAIAAHKLTWDGGEIQFLSKECFSNGCVGTLDVTYPSIPLFLLYNPELVEGMLNPLFKYAASPNWPYAFAPHDVGQYPIANGQVYGLDRETGELKYDMQMPVEECGNAILCVYAVCHYKGDNSYFVRHRNLLTGWADYLAEHGVDPENQLCTDDFAGHLAHNCNLSAKAIMGIAAFGKLLARLGETEEGERYLAVARSYARKWEEMAFDGDHYRLAFDSPDTWSVKYNLVWDRIFGWNIFRPEVFESEIAFYQKKINAYGLPLDSRSDYTKSDWLMWSTRLTGDPDYTEKIVDTMWAMLNESPSRVPFTDWYFTSSAVQRGFQNRTVQGGLFINLL